MTGSAGTAMDVVLRRRKAYKGGSLREGGLSVLPDRRAGGFKTHGKSRVQINSQIRGTDQENPENQGYRSILGSYKWGSTKGLKK